MLHLYSLKLLSLPFALWAWWNARHTNARWWLPAGIQLMLALVAEPLAMWLMWEARPNHGVYNLYMVLEFTTLTWMVMSIPHPSRGSRRLALLTMLLFLAVYGWQWNVQRITGAEPALFHYALIGGGTLLALQSILALHRLVREGPVHPAGNAAIWILASTCLYFISAAPLLVAVLHFEQSNIGIALMLLDLNDLLFMLRYGLMFLGLLFLKRLSLRSA
jgi:hypothetical protein